MSDLDEINRQIPSPLKDVDDAVWPGNRSVFVESTFRYKRVELPADLNVE